MVTHSLASAVASAYGLNSIWQQEVQASQWWRWVATTSRSRPETSSKYYNQQTGAAPVECIGKLSLGCCGLTDVLVHSRLVRLELCGLVDASGMLLAVKMTKQNLLALIPVQHIPAL
jgi:hypothetical protein